MQLEGKQEATIGQRYPSFKNYLIYTLAQYPSNYGHASSQCMFFCLGKLFNNFSPLSWFMNILLRVNQNWLFYCMFVFIII